MVNRVFRPPFIRRKKIRKDELLNLDIEFVSLVERPANGKSMIVKSADGKAFKSRGVAQIKKVKKDGTQGRIYSTVYEPGVKDAHGDSASKAEIQKACDTFSEKGRMKNVDVNHNCVKEDNFYVAENYILKAEDPEFFPGTKVGSWVQVIKCKDTTCDTWKRVEKKEITGVSMFGEADAVSDNAASILAMKSTLDTLKSIVEKSTDGGSEALKAEIKTLEAKINELQGADQDASIQKSLKTIEKSFETLADRLNTVISKSLKGDPEEDDMNGDRTVIGPAGEKLVIKASRKKVRKALQDLEFGKKMDIFNPTDFRLFLDAIVSYGADETLQDISILPIQKDGKVDLGLLQDVILVNETDGDPEEQLVASGDKTMIPQAVKSHVALKRETVEFYKDNYGEDAYLAYIDEKICEGIRNAVGVLVFSGDRTSTDPEEKAINGVVKQAEAANDVIGISVTGIEPEFKTIFKTALKSFNKKILRKKKDFVIYVSDYMLLDIQNYYADRKTAAGDGFLLKDEKVWYNGIPVKARYMDDDVLVVGLSRAIIVGYITDMEMDKGHKLGEWKIHWYTRAKFDIGYLAGNVKVFRLETAPVATDVSISGTAQVGEVLTGNYTFNDANGDAEGETSFRWLSSATPDGTYEAITGATSETYTLVSGDANKYIKFEVTPRSTTGLFDGSPVMSERTGKVAAAG
jgi:hypothetical protein